MSIIKLSNGMTRHVYDEGERLARAAMRLAAGRALVLKHCTPPRVPDFSKCASVPEVEWAKLGGDVEVYRQLTAEDEDVSTVALSALEKEFTGKVSLTTPRRVTESERQESIDDEIRSVLVKLGLDPDLAGASTETEARAIYAAKKGKS